MSLIQFSADTKAPPSLMNESTDKVFLHCCRDRDADTTVSGGDGGRRSEVGQGIRGTALDLSRGEDDGTPEPAVQPVWQEVQSSL